MTRSAVVAMLLTSLALAVAEHPFGAASVEPVQRPPPHSFHVAAVYREDWASDLHTTTLTRFDAFIEHHTTVVETLSLGGRVRMVRSSSRESGTTVLSEEQARGMLIASTAAAVLSRHPRRSEVNQLASFAMCKRSLTACY